MKTLTVIATCLVLSMATACREKASEETTATTVIEEEKSGVTETGQRIGSTKDSTTVDGAPGTPSNN